MAQGSATGQLDQLDNIRPQSAAASCGNLQTWTSVNTNPALWQSVTGNAIGRFKDLGKRSSVRMFLEDLEISAWTSGTFGTMAHGGCKLHSTIAFVSLHARAQTLALNCAAAFGTSGRSQRVCSNHISPIPVLFKNRLAASRSRCEADQACDGRL